VDDVLAAVNARIEDDEEEEEFEKEEAMAALKRLADVNAIMYLPEEGEVYKL